MEKKYELTNECKEVGNHKLYRIRALKDIPRFGVKVGDLGGWIEREGNLSQDGDAWVDGEAVVCGNADVFCNAEVSGEAWVSGNAIVSGDARVYDKAVVFDNARVYDNARIYGDAEVCGSVKVAGVAVVYGDAEVFGSAWIFGDAKVSCNTDFMVFKNTWSSGRYFTYTCSNKKWTVGCFQGTGEELIKKAYADSELSGQCYETIVKAVEQIERAKAVFGKC